MHHLSPSGSNFLPPLVLPSRRVSAWVVETSPADTQQWLAGLTMGEPIQTAQQLYQALFTLNRMDLDPDDRLRIMGLYREPVATTTLHLQTHFSHFALPLRPRLKQLSDFLCQLHMEMAYGYKHVVAAAVHKSRPLENDAVLLAVARVVESLGNVLLRCYQVYMPTPAGVWKELHGLYWFAEHHRRQRSDLSILNSGHELSVSKAYLRVVMLGLCGPYQLPQNEVHRVWAFLHHWADRAEIRSSIDSVDPAGHFLLDLEADHPAVPFPRDVPLHMNTKPALRAVNAVGLARKAHGFIARLQRVNRPRRSILVLNVSAVFVLTP